jgi:hypothetical protein
MKKTFLGAAAVFAGAPILAVGLGVPAAWANRMLPPVVPTVPVPAPVAPAAPPTRIISVCAGPCIAISVFLVYLATLSHNYDGDGIQFAMDVESGDLANLLVPNHMLYPLFGLWFFRGWQFFGWQQGALLPLQVLSALGGALSVGLMYAVSRRLTNSISITIASVVAVGFGVSYGMWVYSTDAESVTIPLALSMLVLLCLIPRHNSKEGLGPLITGLVCSLSILTYQTGVILVLVVIVGYCMDARLTRSVRFQRVSLFLLVSGLITALAYLLVAYFVFGITGWKSLLDWQFHLSRLGLWGKPSLLSFVEGWKAFYGALAGYPKRSNVLDVIVVVIVALVVIIPFGFAFALRKRLTISHRRSLGILVTWSLLYAAFAIYWVAGDISFWVPVLVPWWLLAGMVLSVRIYRIDGVGDPLPRHQPHSYIVATSILTALLLARNLFNIILPNLETNHSYLIAMSVKEHTSPSDLIVTTGGNDCLFLTIPYFAQRETVSLFHQFLNAEKVDQPPSPWIVSPSAAGGVGGGLDKGEVFAKVDRMIREIHLHGGRVFLVGTQPGQDLLWSSLQDVDLTKEDFKHFNTKRAWQAYGEDILEII